MPVLALDGDKKSSSVYAPWPRTPGSPLAILTRRALSSAAADRFKVLRLDFLGIAVKRSLEV